MNSKYGHDTYTCNCNECSDIRKTYTESLNKSIIESNRKDIQYNKDKNTK